MGRKSWWIEIQSQEACCIQYVAAAIGIQHQQVLIASDNGNSPARRRRVQYHIILRIAADAYLLCNFDDFRPIKKGAQECLTLSGVQYGSNLLRQITPALRSGWTGVLCLGFDLPPFSFKVEFRNLMLEKTIIDQAVGDLHHALNVEYVLV